MKFSGPTIDVSAIFRREAARLESLGVDSRKVVRRASGTLLRRLPVEAKRDIQREYNLKPGRVRKDLRARRSGSDAVEITGYRRAIGLIEYGGRWGGRQTEGATFQINPGGTRELLEGTFIATGLSGNRHIFERFGKPQRMTRGRYAGQMREPIHTQYFGSIAGFLVQKGRPERLADFAAKLLASEMQRLLEASTR